MEFFGSYLSMKSRIMADHHESGRILQEVIPEKPKMCLKSPRVTVFKIKSHSYLKYRCSMEKNWLNEGGNKTTRISLRLFGMRSLICK